MKIAVVGTRGMPAVSGGVERHCEELYPRLASMGHEVTVFGRSAYVGRGRTWRGVEVVSLDAPSGRTTETIVHTVRAIWAARQLHPDIVHVHSIGPAGMIPLASVLGLRTVLTVHAFDYQQSKWGALAKAYLRYGEWVGSRMSSATIAVASWMADSLGARYGRRVDYVPSGPLSLVQRPAGDVIRELGLTPGEYVLTVGRLIPDKRIEDLVAASLIGDPIAVVVVGDSSHTDEYAEALRQEAPPNVIFAGARDRRALAELYSNCSVYAHPSGVEGLPLSILEAMSLGVPCVATEIPGNAEVLGGLAPLVQVGDVEALRSEIDGLAGLVPGERDRLGQALRGRVRAHYDWDMAAAAVERIYRRVARVPDAKDCR